MSLKLKFHIITKGTIFGIIIRYGISHPSTKILSLRTNNVSIHDLPEFIYLSVANQSKEEYVYTFTSPKLKKDDVRREYEEKATFNPEIFFNILLPPIIFNAGYSMKRVTCFFDC